MQQCGWISIVYVTYAIGYILCDSIYMEVWKRQNYRDGEQIYGCQWLGVWGRMDYKGGASWNFLRNGTLLFHLDGSLAAWLRVFVKTHTANRVNLLCNLKINIKNTFKTYSFLLLKNDLTTTIHLIAYMLILPSIFVITLVL